MASFAKLKPSNNVVLDVIKIGNDIPTSNGPLGDKFIVQQPHASWTLDANDDWQAPVTIPTDESLTISDSVVLIRWPYWNEEEYRWESHNILADPTVAYHWDTDTDTWVIS